MPSVLLSCPSSWKTSVNMFCDYYSEDVPDIFGFPAELILWQIQWEGRVLEIGIDKVPNKVSDTLMYIDPVAYANIFCYS